MSERAEQPADPGQGPQPGRPPEPPVPPGWAPVQPPPSGGSGPPQSGWTQPPQGGWTQPQHGGWVPPPSTYPQPGAGYGWAGAPQAPPPPPKPGVIPLRPLGVGELLDGAITSIRRDPRVMLGISALVVTISTLLQTLLTWALLGEAGSVLTQPSDAVTEDELLSLAGGSAVAFGISLVLSIVTQVVLTGILTYSVSKAVLGEHASAAQAWEAAKRRLLPLLGLTLLVLLLVGTAVVVPLLPGLLVLLAGADVAGAVLLVVGVPVAIVAALGVAVLTWFGAPVVVLERQPVVRALRRSAALVRPNVWRILGLWLLLQVLVAVFGGILSGPLAVVSTFAFDNPFGLPALSLQAVGTILASTVTLPFAAAVTVLVYVDQRIRREALDLELTRAAGLHVPGQSATPGTAPAGPAGRA